MNFVFSNLIPLTVMMMILATNQRVLATPQAGLQATETAGTPAQQADDDRDDPTRLATVESSQATTDAIGPSYRNPVSARWKVGVQVVGGSRPARNMFITIPVPNEWPEQTVTVASEDIPSSIGNVRVRDLESGVKQLLISMPTVGARQETIATMTFLVTTSQVEPPADPAIFEKPKSSSKQAKMYLGVSPNINYRNSKMRKLVKELVTDQPNPWKETEALFDWVIDNIEQRESSPSGIDDVFKQGYGCAEDRVAMFVGLCRANKVPARMVWVEGTQYAEFMLADAEGNSYWFPCNVNGIREFGSISDPRIILQKGDSIRVPEKEQRQKFVAEFATCSGQAKPSVKFIRQLLPAEE